MTGEDSEPLVSVVIVNYNGKRFLQDCLSALQNQTYRHFEVILVDNASHDGSVQFTEENFPSVRIFVQDTNLGFAGGSNAGIRISKGEFILTLNNDTIVSPDFIQELLQPMLSDPGIGMCGSKMVFPDGRINSTAICISRCGAAWDRGSGEPDQGQYDTAEEIFGPCAGAALYRRTMLDDIGLFDEDFFLFMEDVDLAFRGRMAGWKCRYVPGAKVVHIHGGTAIPRSAIAIYYVNRNTLWFVMKNFPVRTLIISIPWILGRNCVVLPYYLLSGKFLTVIKAKADALKGLPVMIHKRREINKKIPEKTIEKWIQSWNRFHKFQ